MALVAHGSPDSRHSAGVTGIAARLSSLLGADVTTGYLEHNSPRAADVTSTEGAEGSRVVLPLLLTAGFHWRHDIPPVAATAAASVALLAPPPLELFAPAAVDLLVSQPRPRAVVVLAGSRSAQLPARMAALLEGIARIRSSHGVDRMEVALARDPRTAAGLIDARTVVLPFVVAEGIFADRIRDNARKAGAAVTPVLGSTGGFASALADYCTESVAATPLLSSR